VDVTDVMTWNKCCSVADLFKILFRFYGLYSRNDCNGRIEKICHGEL